MLYRLLRNNKESGPYTTLQLKEMGLKPYDLLWTEGRGAAWQYASEIPELKSFAPVVEEQPFDRFYKRKEVLETAQQPTGSVRKTKPRFRISNGQLIMIEAGNMEVANNGMIKETAPVRLPKEPVMTKEKPVVTDWKEAYSEWQPQLQNKVVKIEEPVEVETKYSESLDDLKKRYAEKVLNEKTARPSSSVSAASVKQNIMAALALIVLATGGYIGYTLKQKGGVATESKPAVERADIVRDNDAVSPQNNDNTVADNLEKATAKNVAANSDTKNTETPAVSANTQKIVSAVLVKNKTNAAIQPQNVLLKKEENTVAAATHLPESKPVDKTNTAAGKKTEVAKTNSTATANKPLPQPQLPTASVAKNTGSSPVTTSPAETKVVVKQNAPKNINDYLSVKKLGGSTAGVQNVRLLVNNVSDFPIDLAVIDIQYFDNKGKYQKGETMYVKNIDGGNNVELRVPDSDKSSSIKYKVSLVSSEKKTLYLVAD